MNIQHFLKEKKVMFLSPHFDDFAYSCSGLLSLGVHFNQLVLINIFTQSRYAPNLLTKDVACISSIRSFEDLSFCQYHQLEFINLGFDDSSLRGYNDRTELESYNILTDNVFPLVEIKLRDLISELEFDVLFCPLGLGNHIDHAIIFQILQRINVAIPVFYYEDLPYVCKFGAYETGKIIVETFSQSIQFSLIPVNKTFKTRNIRNYTSQFDLNTLSNILKYSQNIDSSFDAVERVWILNNQS